jgi:hypothetical protein
MSCLRTAFNQLCRIAISNGRPKAQKRPVAFSSPPNARLLEAQKITAPKSPHQFVDAFYSTIGLRLFLPACANVVRGKRRNKSLSSVYHWHVLLLLFYVAPLS